MKKKIIIVLAFLLALPLAAMAGKIKDDVIGFSFQTPKGWTVAKQKMPGAEMIGHTAAQSTVGRQVPMTTGDLKDWGIGIAQDTAISAVGYGVTRSVMKGLPKFVNYQFKNLIYPEATMTLMAVEAAAMPQGQDLSQQSEEVEVTDKKGKTKKVKRECKTIWKEDRKWGGEPASIFTTRCSHGEGKWMYTAMANMDRKGINYILNGNMTSKSPDDSDFDQHMKPAILKIIDSMKFKKK
jgi:hypothetical protein